MGAVCHVYASRYRDVAHEHVREHIAEHIAREQCEGGCFKRKVFELTLCLYKEVLCHVASGETRKRARQETRGADLRWYWRAADLRVRRAGGRSGILALVLFGWINVGLLLLESLVFLTLTV